MIFFMNYHEPPWSWWHDGMMAWWHISTSEARKRCARRPILAYVKHPHGMVPEMWFHPLLNHGLWIFNHWGEGIFMYFLYLSYVVSQNGGKKNRYTPFLSQIGGMKWIRIRMVQTCTNYLQKVGLLLDSPHCMSQNKGSPIARTIGLREHDLGLWMALTHL